MIYFQVVLKINIIYSHLFYIPIILACIWWKANGLIITTIIALIFLFFPTIMIKNGFELYFFENMIGSIIIVVVGLIISFLSNRLSKEEVIHNAYDDLSFFRALLIHDMNNIFQGIKFASELYLIYENEGGKEDEFKELIEIIGNQCLKGFELISNVKKLSELEINRQKLEKVTN
ncbi:MAG: hypothetical protein ACFE8P_12120 [Promethearchaeota archaeon]